MILNNDSNYCFIDRKRIKTFNGSQIPTRSAAQPPSNQFDNTKISKVFGGTSYSYTWNVNITIKKNTCFSIVLPPGKSVYIPDGYSFDVEDDADFIIFSL